MKSALEKKYLVNLENITEKDIIYFCRDSLSFNKSAQDKMIYEKEILEIIKSRQWDYTVKDIDKNNMLLYPIYNNAFNIVSYLIENKKYNLQEYDKDVSRALCACIMPIGENMNDYILSKNIHNNYIGDMVFQAYTMSISEGMKESFIDYYKQKADFLLKQNASFENILHHFLETSEFPLYRNIFVNFLQEHPLNTEEKLDIIKPILEVGKEKSLTFIKKEKNRMLDNWVRYVEMDIKLPPKNEHKKKNKI